MGHDWYVDQLDNWWMNAKKGLDSFDKCTTPEEARACAERWYRIGDMRYQIIMADMKKEPK